MALTKHFTIITLFVTALASVSNGEPYLVGSGMGITKRDEIVQGWALVEQLCPDGTGRCGEETCCPDGSYCDANENTYSNLCCPTRKSSHTARN
jgi:hypothetical protein